MKIPIKITEGNSTPAEEWRGVVGYEGIYEVSNLGRIRSLPRKLTTKNNIIRNLKGKIIKPRVRTTGYIGFMPGMHKKEIQVHRIVLSAFIRQPFPFEVGNHKNGIKSDNRLGNLEWVTYKGNYEHATKIGLQKSNKGKKWSQLTTKQIREIRKSYGEIRSSTLSKKFNVSQHTISRVGLYKTFKNI